MVSLSDFIPFYPKKDALPRARFDVDRALQVEVHAHPTLKQQRAANGELILVVDRELLPAEKFLSRFFRINRQRRIVLDKYGEFVLTECLKPGTRLTTVAQKLAAEFDIEPEKAKRGVIQMIKDLLLRGFVFLIRTP